MALLGRQNRCRSLRTVLIACLLIMITAYSIIGSRQSAPDPQQAQHRSPRSLSSDTEELSRLRQHLFTIERPPDSRYDINETLSQTIPMVRDLPENRPSECRSLQYDTDQLPTISVVIPMYNEAPSMLLRTVHSILARTPPKLLADIIIVDDMSTNLNMKDALTEYMALLSPKVKLLRLTKKAHLIKARMAGAASATGEVLLFQDAHTEMADGWAEPVLDYIQKNPHTIVQPSVDTIDQTTIVYESRGSSVNLLWRGVLLWDLRYAWHKAPERYDAWQLHRSDPVPCPILVGCSIAVSKKYFQDIGGFDTSLDVWGGEQIELSLRTWMCGGKVVIHPCSRTGHVFKPWMKSDVEWRKREQAIAKNNMRIAEIWMGRYASYYYATNRIYEFKRVELTQEEKYSILAQRRENERRMCQDFSWFLAHVFPELKEPNPDARYFGEVQNEYSKACLKVAPDGFIIMTYDCFIYSRLQDEAEFAFTGDGRMLYNNKCVRVNQYSLLELGDCLPPEPEQAKITFRNSLNGLLTQGRIELTFQDGKKLCLEQITNALDIHREEQMPQFLACGDDKQFQVWNVNYHLDYSLVPPPLFTDGWHH